MEVEDQQCSRMVTRPPRPAVRCHKAKDARMRSLETRVDPYFCIRLNRLFGKRSYHDKAGSNFQEQMHRDSVFGYGLLPR